MVIKSQVALRDLRPENHILNIKKNMLYIVLTTVIK